MNKYSDADLDTMLSGYYDGQKTKALTATREHKIRELVGAGVIEGTPTSVRIFQDTDVRDPRTEENIGIMACYHRKYRLGDADVPDIEEMKKIEADPDYVWLPIYMMDHTGILISTSSTRFAAADPSRWDWGRLGTIYCKITEGARSIGHSKAPDIKERLLKVLQQEVDIYNQYLIGEVYGYEILDECGEVLGSCGGYYGDPETSGIRDCLPEHLKDPKLWLRRDE